MKDTLSTWQTGRRRAATNRSGPDDACLSNLALDRLAQGECEPPEQEQLRAHLQSCARCSGAAEALTADRHRFVEESDIPALARDALARAAQVPARSRLSRWLVPVLGASMAAAGLMVLTRPAEQPDEMRAKRGFTAELYVKHAEGPADGRLHLGEALHPGDRVRLRLLTPEGAGAGQRGDAGRFVAVLAVDADAAVSVYYPQGPTTAELSDAWLPSAVELDATLGGEVIVAFSCPQPQPVKTLVAAVQQALDPAKVQTDPAGALGAIDTPCVTTRYRIDKVPRAGAP